MGKNSPAEYRKIEESAHIAESVAIVVIKDLEGANQENIEKETHNIFDKAVDLLEKYGRIEDMPATLRMRDRRKSYYKYFEYSIGDSYVFVETSLPRESEQAVEKKLKEKNEIILLRIHNQGEALPKIKFTINNEAIHICRSSENKGESKLIKKPTKPNLMD